MVSNGDIFTFSSMLIFWLFWRKTLLIKAFFVFFDVVLPLTFSYTPNIYLKKNIAEKNPLNSSVFWFQNQSYVDSITENYKSLEKIGLQILPEEEKLYWRTCICNTQDEIFSLIASLTNICKVELDFIEKYIPDTVDITSQQIINRIPADCTLEEATKYQQNYHTVLDYYNNHYERKKNIWNKLFHFLGRDTHHFPSGDGMH